ncbi:MAG: bifunctional [glutamate--ammonia ligase]-adenylyl-L-tyrosine phosphorylase/[glutamate--ammonia-ligase] adenylyltransferase [Limnohabitans sp.]|nr:bifunctional [glutamate--ammonia ligase]-adenylyl-L-tyrosine phosphorylase/[glutamate--ammonia-ligase] adenylyltransferase [Limnohabitans sp.]
MQNCFDGLRPIFTDLPHTLRVLRQLVVERLVVLDCEQNAPLETVTHAMSELAQFSLNQAFTHAQSVVDAIHGSPRDSQGNRAVLWIIGMGKLGARELNVSSDIDLIYIYNEDGQTDGLSNVAGSISNFEYFSKIVKIIFSCIGEITEHGQVFRMDLALRPNGLSGPVVLPLDALEEYFLVQGREWERFAWLKSRVVAPFVAIEQSKDLRNTVVPFVFRRFLDYSIFESLRKLHQLIRDNAHQRYGHRMERNNDVKLGRGGIREIEFIVQLLQVVRGGQAPELRTRATQVALQRLSHAQLITQETVHALNEAYIFLRRLEHRIQYLDDQQTHVLPSQTEDLQWIAQTMGFDSAPSFQTQLEHHRHFVANEFDRLLNQGDHAPNKNEASQLISNWQQVLDQLSTEFEQRIALWLEHPHIRVMRDEVQQRLMGLVLRTQDWINEKSVTLIGAVRWSEWIESLFRRDSYLSLLLERPHIHRQLLDLLGAARWPARYLIQHPSVMDELATANILNERFDAPSFEQLLETRRLALDNAHQADEEALLNLLRSAHHAEVFLTLARDVPGKISVEQVADDLSGLADTILRVTSRWVWSRLKQRHRQSPQFAILSYGKHGGKELGYGSDLDIVFIYDDEHPQAAEIYSQFARKLINWLTVKTGQGDLYEIDTALRPNGNSGLLVSSMEAFADYQAQRGSNTAWVWEHQAMTRARFCTGEERLKEPFDNVRYRVLTTSRDLTALRKDILAMRHKLRHARPVKSEWFDVKHSAGAMVDVEFVVQYLVLGYSHQHLSLVDNLGNIALLNSAESLGLLPANMGLNASQAYRVLRQVQHRARLNEEPTQLPNDQLQTERKAILDLWNFVFAIA